MFAFAVSTNFHVFASQKKEMKRFKKFGKKLAQDRRDDFQRMADKMRDIANEEKRRTKELLREHREFFEKRDVDTIEFYEKK